MTDTNDRDARAANRIVYTIIARHGHGVCVRCGDEIAVGDTIYKLAGIGWLCRECACGWLSLWCPTRDAAIDAFDHHVDEERADIDDMLRDKYEPWVD